MWSNCKVEPCYCCLWSWSVTLENKWFHKDFELRVNSVNIMPTDFGWSGTTGKLISTWFSGKQMPEFLVDVISERWKIHFKSYTDSYNDTRFQISQIIWGAYYRNTFQQFLYTNSKLNFAISHPFDSSNITNIAFHHILYSSHISSLCTFWKSFIWVSSSAKVVIWNVKFSGFCYILWNLNLKNTMLKYS